MNSAAALETLTEKFGIKKLCIDLRTKRVFREEPLSSRNHDAARTF